MTTDSMSSPRTPERRLYVVATVHLDTQWRWTVQDTIREFIPNTLDRNFELLQRAVQRAAKPVSKHFSTSVPSPSATQKPRIVLRGHGTNSGMPN